MLKKNMADKQMDTLKKVFCYIKKYRGYLILSVFLAALTVISTLYIPILIGDAIDFIIDAGKVDFKGLMPRLMEMVIVIFITAIAQWIMNVCNNKMTYRIVRAALTIKR